MRTPWHGEDGEPVQPSEFTRLDLAVIGLAFLHDVAQSQANLIQRIKYGVMAAYNNGIAMDDFMQAIDPEVVEAVWVMDEEDEDG